MAPAAMAPTTVAPTDSAVTCSASRSPAQKRTDTQPETSATTKRQKLQPPRYREANTAHSRNMSALNTEINGQIEAMLAAARREQDSGLPMANSVPSNSKSESTKAAYKRHQVAWVKWCGEHHGGDETVEPVKMAEFLREIHRAHQAKGGKAALPTIKIARSAITAVWEFQVRSKINCHPKPSTHPAVQSVFESLGALGGRGNRVEAKDKVAGSIIDNWVSPSTISSIADSFITAPANNNKRALASQLGHRLAFLLSFSGALRCESTRNLALSDLSTVFAESEGTSGCTMLVLTLGEGKGKKSDRFLRTAIMRHAKVEQCLLGAMAIYFVCAFHLNGTPFPAMQTADDWYYQKVIQSTGGGSKKKRKRNSTGDQDVESEDESEEGQYDYEDEDEWQAEDEEEFREPGKLYFEDLSTDMRHYLQNRVGQGLVRTDPDGQPIPFDETLLNRVTSKIYPNFHFNADGDAVLYSTDPADMFTQDGPKNISIVPDNVAAEREEMAHIERHFASMDQPQNRPVGYRTQWHAFKAAQKRAGVRSTRASHLARAASSSVVSKAGVDMEQLRVDGQWNAEMTKCYLDGFPLPVCRVLAGHRPESHLAFNIARDVEVPEELLKLVFPEVDRLLEQWLNGTACSPTAVAFLRTMKFLRQVFWQDSVFLRQRWPEWRLWEMSMFKHPAYEPFAARVLEATKPKEKDNPMNRLPKAVASDIVSLLEANEKAIQSITAQERAKHAEMKDRLTALARQAAINTERRIAHESWTIAMLNTMLETIMRAQGISNPHTSSAAGAVPTAGSSAAEGSATAGAPVTATVGSVPASPTPPSRSDSPASQSPEGAGRLPPAAPTTATSGATPSPAAQPRINSIEQVYRDTLAACQEARAAAALSDLNSNSRSGPARSESGNSPSREFAYTTMSKESTTVAMLWEEWNVGTLARPSVKSMIANHGKAWLTGDERGSTVGAYKFFDRRRTIIRLVQEHPLFVEDNPAAAVNAIENLRGQSSIDRFAKSLTKAKVAELVSSWDQPTG